MAVGNNEGRGKGGGRRRAPHQTERAPVRVSEYIPRSPAPEIPVLPAESPEQPWGDAGIPGWDPAFDVDFDDDLDGEQTVVGHLQGEDEPAPADLPLKPAPPSNPGHSVRPPLAPPSQPDTPPPQPVPSPIVGPIASAQDGQLVGGRYRVANRIGEGGMGKVFQVTHAHLDKTFALKIIHHNFAGQTKVRDLFYREARLASSLSHPNIVSVVDFGEDQQVGAFMVMEFLEGRRLSSALRREKRLNLRQTCDIMLQVAEALHYIHGRNIVHCDIKTENILLCEQPGSKRRKQVVKLLDFGLARSTATRNTASLSGTPHYVAPERIRGEQAGPQSDIYGLGILFYELLTGRVPWDGNVAEILCGHLEKQPPPPSGLVPDGLDPAAEQLILRALAKDPAKRHKDMAAFLYELNTVMDMLGFGRRTRRGGSRQRIVVERTENKRDELIRTVFDSMRLPMAMINARGTIAVANSAFAKFVMGVAAEVEGLSAGSTPLANVWKNFEADMARALAGAHLRRVVELDGAGGDTWRLLMWLDPGTGNDHVIFGVHPLDP